MSTDISWLHRQCQPFNRDNYCPEENKELISQFKDIKLLINIEGKSEENYPVINLDDITSLPLDELLRVKRLIHPTEQDNKISQYEIMQFLNSIKSNITIGDHEYGGVSTYFKDQYFNSDVTPCILRMPYYENTRDFHIFISKTFIHIQRFVSGKLISDEKFFNTGEEISISRNDVGFLDAIVEEHGVLCLIRVHKFTDPFNFKLISDTSGDSSYAIKYDEKNGQTISREDYDKLISQVHNYYLMIAKLVREVITKDNIALESIIVRYLSNI
jgi:hypothetical protein